MKHNYSLARRRFLAYLSTVPFVVPIERLLGQSTTAKSTTEVDIIRNMVRQIIVEQIGVDEKEVTENADMVKDLKADSLDLVELMMACEEAFEIEISDEDWARLHTVGDAVTYISLRVPKATLDSLKRRAAIVVKPKASVSRVIVYPVSYKYTKEHEWLNIQGSTGFIGLTEYAQTELGDIVFVELPKVGSDVVADKAFGSVESVKAVSDLFAPVSGKVIAVNETLKTSPEQLNKDAFGTWMIRITLKEPNEAIRLLSVNDYRKFVTTRFRSLSYAYVISGKCTKRTECVDACPVDAIHPKKGEKRFDGAAQLYIDPVECINCGACVPVCPSEAIFAWDDLPKKWRPWGEKNAKYFGR
jgi:glycine cleavage system H protein